MARTRGCCAEFAGQTRLLLRKNFALLLRNRTATIIQLLVPFIFIGVLFLLQFATTENVQRNPALAESLDGKTIINTAGIRRCILQPGQDKCYTLGFLPSTDPIVLQIVAQIKENEGIPDEEVIGFYSESEANTFTSTNPNTTQAIIQFYIDYGCDYSPTTTPVAEYAADACMAQNHTKDDTIGIRYVVQYNQTVTTYRGQITSTFFWTAVPVQLAVEQAVFQVFGPDGVDLQFNMTSFPHPSLLVPSVVSLVGPAFFFGALMFNFVIQIGQIVVEKELHLRESMRVMGLLDSAYWVSWGIVNIVSNIVSGFLLIASAAIFQFQLVLLNDFLTYFFLVMLFVICMVPLAMFISTLLSHSSTATTLGFAIFLIGAMIQATAGLIYDKDTHPAIIYIFSLFPPTPFARGLSDLADATNDPDDEGMRFSEVSTHDDFWPMSYNYAWLAGHFGIWIILTIFFDNVLYMHRPPWFFLLPSYWCGTKRKGVHDDDPRGRFAREVRDEDMDSDVLEEENRIKADKANEAVIIDNLNKTFFRKIAGCCPVKGGDFRAVKNVYFTIENGSLFCLLGHNGAGKTTTIRILTGLYNATHGDANIFGNSLIDGMAEIRQIMGVCPQHDILWTSLTAREHLELFAGLKNIPAEDLGAEVQERLEDVALSSAADLVAGSYSGGMRRRLSVAIALIGDPKIVFLDEPTTGMDPVSRRQVWNLIERVKRGRVTLLTTHSMEEADILGDKIAIMKAGRIAALGTSLRLKNKYGTGYTVSVVSDDDKTQMEKIEKFVQSTFDKLKADPNAAQTKAILYASDDEPVALDNSDDKANGKKKKRKKKAQENGRTNGSTEKLGKKPEPTQVTVAPVDTKEKVKLESSKHGISTFKIPLGLAGLMPAFFEKLESSSKKLGIHDFQLNMTTLEEVFIKVADEEQPEEVARDKKKQKMPVIKKVCIAIAIICAILCILVAIGTSWTIRLSRPEDHGPTVYYRTLEPQPFLHSSYHIDTALFPSGIQVGDVTSQAAVLSIRTAAAMIDVHILKANGDESWEPYMVVSNLTRAPTSQSVFLDFFGLDPDTAYTVFAVAKNDSTAASQSARFRSAFTPKHTARVVEFGATSSFGRTNAPWTSLDFAAERKLDFFMLLGDNVYSGFPPVGRKSKYSQMLTTEGFQNLSSSTSFIATWNDQELGENWYFGANSTDLTFKLSLYNPALADFSEAIPWRRSSPTGLYRRINYGSTLDVFVLDLQSERMSNQIMSQDQMDWLKDGLSFSAAKFKAIMSSVAFSDLTSLLVFPVGSWDLFYNDQRMELLDHIVNNTIRGVFFVSGDLQFGTISTVESIPKRPDDVDHVAWGRYNISEIAVGPVGTRVRPEVIFNARTGLGGGSQFQSLVDTYSWTKFRANPTFGTLEVEFINDLGTVVANRTIELGLPL